MSPAHSVEKLEQMLSADPASKVFLPLGEQYRKAGQLERAAEVLRTGLTHNPGYAAAEVALARVLLEQGDADAGRILLTRVVRAVPDNLLAQRLLEEAGGPLEDAGGTAPDPAPPAQDTPQDEDGREAEPVWASTESLAEPVEPPVPEPGVWKSEEPDPEPRHAGTDGTDEDEDDGPPEGPSPFETVRLSRDDLDLHPGGQEAGDEPPDQDESRHQDDPPPDAEPSHDPAREALDLAGPEGASDEPAEEEPAVPMMQPEPQDPEPDPAEQEPVVAHVAAAPDDEESQPDVAEVLSMAADTFQGGSLDPDESARLLSLARLYRRQGDLDRAAGVYRDLLDGEPDHAEARRELAELCGEGLAEISDEDLIPPTTRLTEEVQPATMESVEDARRRKVAFLRSWLEHIRSQP